MRTFEHSRSTNLRLPSLFAALAAVSIALAAPVRAEEPAKAQVTGSSIPVDPKAVEEKKAALDKQPEPVKPDERIQHGSSVPVAHPVWLDKPAPGARPLIPHVNYVGAQHNTSVQGSMDSTLEGEGPKNWAAGIRAEQIKCKGKACTEWSIAMGAGNTPPYGSAPVAELVGKLHIHPVAIGAKLGRDFRFEKIRQAEVGTLLGSARLSSTLRLTAGYGSLQPLDSKRWEHGVQAKAELDSYLGDYTRLMAQFEGGKYTHGATRLKGMLGLRFTTRRVGEIADDSNYFFVQPEATFDSASYKVVPNGQIEGQEDGETRKIRAITGTLSVGTGF